MRPVWLAAGFLWGGVAAVLAMRAGWPRETAFMAAIFVTAGLLWITEAIPLFATALLILGGEILLLANPAGWPALAAEASRPPSLSGILAAAADPLMLLFLGGLMLARSASEEGVDRVVSAWILRPFGERPRGVLLGVLVTTAVLSMWMSNTATAALMLTLVGPVAARCPEGDPFRRALFLAVPIGANLGGIGTPVASPPNAIAAGMLSQAGVRISFVGWMAVALPCLAVLLTTAWWVLGRWYPATIPRLPSAGPPPRLTVRGRAVLAVLVAAIGLWLSDRWHGLPASVVGLLVILALTMSGLLGSASLRRLDWGVLILIAGGLALGAGMQWTGLDDRLVAWLPDPGLGGGMGFHAALLAVAVVLGAFMSNTAAANILIPLTLSAYGMPADGSAATAAPIALSVAVALAVAMFLPSSTPPNALAHSSRMFGTGDLIRVAAVLTSVAFFLALFLVPPIARWAGWGPGG